MPDITKCSSEYCPLKENCFRYTCKPDEFWQSYSNFEGALNEDQTKCDYFIDNKEAEKKGLQDF